MKSLNTKNNAGGVKEKIKKRYHSWLEEWLGGWLDRRSPISKSIKLTQKRIYIIPSKMGLWFLGLTTLMFVNAMNYQNNLIFSFSVLLLSIFITSIVVTYQNMAGLVITAKHGAPVFSGNTTMLHIVLEHNAKKTKDGLMLGFNREQAIALTPIQSKLATKFEFKTHTRGFLHVRRLSIFSVYPVGLFTCWTWIKLDFEGLVYPSPLFTPFQYVGQAEAGAETALNVVSRGVDDFRGFKAYQNGDSLKHVAWRQYAKTNQLLTKEFELPQAQGHWLDWHALPGYKMEHRLQILCGWVVRSHEDNREYGLSLPNVRIASGRGDAHQQACLTALALYGLDARPKQVAP